MKLKLEELINLRRSIHQYPEVSGNEVQTAEKIKSFLKIHSPDQLIDNIGGYGIAAVYKGRQPGRNVLIRCELDALPIEEINDFEHASKNEGVGHMCGHDGHSAIVAGLATVLAEEKPKKGNVILLFQPAEESGEGAKAVLKDEKFHQLKPDLVFALHNLPEEPKHKIVLKRGLFTAAVNSMVVKLIGKTSHAGQPDKGINPALAMSEIFLEIDKLNNPDQESPHFGQISYIHAFMGEEAYGTSAGEAELGFTFRCWNNEERDKLGDKMAKIVKAAGKRHHLSVEVSYTESFHANENHDMAVNMIECAANQEDLSIKWRELPHRWGEDFGVFTKAYPGALFGLGAGKNTPTLHNPDYDFPDDIIETGVKMFYQIIKQANQ